MCSLGFGELYFGLDGDPVGYDPPAGGEAIDACCQHAGAQSPADEYGIWGRK